MPTSIFHQHFPGYEILAELGRSNARVLKARNQVTGDLVAIKHFAFNTDQATLHRFQRESEIMTSISSYNIVKVREVRLESEMPYVVMDFIEGGDLRGLLKERGTLDVTTIIRLGLQMTEAFKAIHEQGIVHRDIKPENIMYRHLPSGELHFLLTDFGIARVREQTTTVTGQSLLTYEYASPEQFDHPRDVNKATDYYSLGVVLYECLAGKTPFILEEGRVHSFINQVMSMPPPPVASNKENIPENLRKLLNGLLEKKVENRITDDVTLRRLLKRAEMEEIEGPAMPVRKETATYTQPAIARTMPANKTQLKPSEPSPVQKKSNSQPNRILIWLGVLMLAVATLYVFKKEIFSDRHKDVSNKRITKNNAGNSAENRSAELPDNAQNNTADTSSVSEPAKNPEEITMEDGTFFDDFSENTNGWTLSSDSTKLMSIANGKFRIKGLTNEFSYNSSLPFRLNTQKDFTVSVNVRWIRGINDNGFGLNFCSDFNRSAYFIFIITANGSYAVSKTTNGRDWTNLVEWTYSSFINQGNATNNLSIIKRDDNFQFMINDNEVKNLTIDDSFGNSFGLRVSAAQTVDFDNFTLKGSK